MKRNRLTLLILAMLVAACSEEAKSKQPKASVIEKAASPTKLKPLMIQIGVDFNAITNALWRDDFAGISKAAQAIADHPHVDADEKKRIKRALGSAMIDFVKGDKRVHGAAARLSRAAARSDAKTTLDELAELQAGCFDCHAKFRKKLRQ